MRACLLTTFVCSLGLLAGCLPSSFDDFKFGGGQDGGAADGGGAGQSNLPAGRGGGAGTSTIGGSGATAGSATNAGRGGGGSSGRAGNSGIAGASGASGGGGQDAGVDAGMPCVKDADCLDARAYQCTNMQCVLRRLPSSVWSSGGGGITQSGNFVLRVSVGAPQPLGTTKSNAFTVTVGAGAGRP